MKQKQLETILYALVVESIMYVQLHTQPNISFTAGILRRYQSNLGIEHWKAKKKIMRYLQG